MVYCSVSSPDRASDADLLWNSSQLAFEPTTETRNRKPLKRPVVFMATWEIRFGPQNRFRAYYDVDLEQAIVAILAIGRKYRHRVVIGGEEIQL
jgi:hypothetical protein